MKIKLIRKIKQRIRDISNVWSVAGIRNVYVMAILPHFGSKSTRDIRRERKQQAILHYRKHSKKCTFYTLRFGCSFAAVNTIKPQLL